MFTRAEWQAHAGQPLEDICVGDEVRVMPLELAATPSAVAIIPHRSTQTGLSGSATVQLYRLVPSVHEAACSRALVTLVRNEGQRASHVRRRVRLCTAVRLYGCTAHSRTVASSYGSRSAYSLQLATACKNTPFSIYSAVHLTTSYSRASHMAITYVCSLIHCTVTVVFFFVPMRCITSA
eukprot:COSAG01_NODE_1911_length_8925_cov_151.747111_12_plen_180_part_00